MIFVGWLGSICLGVCGLPQAYKCYKTKSAEGISSAFLFFWLIGEIATLLYVFPKLDLPLICNYLFNIFLICVILRYKYEKQDYEILTESLKSMRKWWT